MKAGEGPRRALGLPLLLRDPETAWLLLPMPGPPTPLRSATSRASVASCAYNAQYRVAGNLPASDCGVRSEHAGLGNDDGTVGRICRHQLRGAFGADLLRQLCAKQLLIPVFVHRPCEDLRRDKNILGVHRSRLEVQNDKLGRQTVSPLLIRGRHSGLQRRT